MTSVAGKVVIVTGAMSGIGAAVAGAFGEAGAHVVTVDRAGGADIVGDVADRSVNRAAVDLALAAHGRLDVFIGSAGVATWRLFAQIDDDVLEETVRTNFLGLYRGAQEAARAIEPDGCMIFTASTGSIRGSRGLSSYAPTKAAVLSLAQCLAAELAPVRVNCVCPGRTNTGIVGRVAHEPLPHPRAPLGRTAMPEEIAGAYLFLASDAARFMTGAAVVVDGGETAVLEC